LVSVTDGLYCITCTSTINSGCGDPYTGGTSTSSNYSSSGWTSCSKIVITTGNSHLLAGSVARSGYANGTVCTSGSYDPDGLVGSLYCCSDRDNCNGATGHTTSIFCVVSLMIGSLLAKRALFFN
ncbi:unnamed protein product, partial [Rotaria socialis]